MNNQNKNSDNRTNRRGFLITTGNLIIGIAGAGVLGASYSFLRPSVLKEIPPRFKIGSPKMLQPGSYIYNEEYNLFLVRNSEGGFYAMSAVCTHLGCTIKWRPVSVPGYSEGIISCPCHGSVYDKFGHVLTGPAPRSLDHYKIQLQHNLLIVDTSIIVSPEETLTL